MLFILSHYYVTTIALIALCALAMICDNRKLASEMLWPGFSTHVQMSSLWFSYFCLRSGTALYLIFTPVRVRRA